MKTTDLQNFRLLEEKAGKEKSPERKARRKKIRMQARMGIKSADAIVKEKIKNPQEKQKHVK